MSSINVYYFASLREKACKNSETITAQGSYGDLYKELSEKYHFGLPAEMVQIAVNDEFASMDEKIEEGAKVVFIPPVAGG